MKNKWFEEVFIQSLIKKAVENTKHNNQIILSEKQLIICENYMKTEENFSDTMSGGIISRGSYLTYYTENGYKVYVRKRGKYFFLSYSKIPTKEQCNKAREIKSIIDKLEDELDVAYDHSDNIKIGYLEAKINSLWNDYNNSLKVN